MLPIAGPKKLDNLKKKVYLNEEKSSDNKQGQKQP